MKRMILIMLCAALLIGCTAGTGDPVRQATGTPAASPVFLTPAPETTDAPSAAPTDTPAPIITEAPTATPEPIPTEAPTAESTETPTPAPTAEPDMDEVERFLAYAESMEGKPYQRGGTTEDGFDPGGFVYACLKHVGVKVSHKSSKGYSEYEKWTRIDDLDDVVPGDLLFFITPSNESVNCATIYLGDGRMIYPSSSRGEVIITKLHTKYWEGAFAFARRVF